MSPPEHLLLRLAHGVTRRVLGLDRRAYVRGLQRQFNPRNPWLPRLTGIGMPWRRKRRCAPWAWAALLAPAAVFWALGALLVSSSFFGRVIAPAWLALPFIALPIFAAAGFCCGIESRRALLRETLLLDSLVTPMPLRLALSAMRARVAAWSALFGLLFLILGVGFFMAVFNIMRYDFVSEWMPAVIGLCMIPTLAVNFAAGVYRRASSAATAANIGEGWYRGMTLTAISAPIALLRGLAISMAGLFLLWMLLTFIFVFFYLLDLDFPFSNLFETWSPIVAGTAIAGGEWFTARLRLRDSVRLWEDFFRVGDYYIRRTLKLREKIA